MRMRSVLSALAVALALGAPVSAWAFQIVSVPANSDGSARYADPDPAGKAAGDAQDKAYDRSQSALGGSWYRHDSAYDDRYVGATPREDRSDWGSSMLDNPQR